MDHVDALVGHLAWPLVVAALVIVFRHQLHELVEEIRRRISDRTSSFGIKAGPLDVQVMAVDAKVRALEENQTVLKVAMKDVAGVSRESGSSAEIPPELIEMADRYLAIDIPDWEGRLRAKDELAAEMGSFVLTHRVLKDSLASQVNEGLLLALAEIVRLSAETTDLQRLRLAAPRLSRLHVRYRLLLALGRLLDARCVKPEDAPSIGEILQLFVAGADRPLQAQIDRTNAQLTTFLREAGVAPS